jgi:hypothetical protein
VRLLDDEKLRHGMAVKARDRVLERFTLAQSLDAYRDLYERLSNPELTAEPAPAPDDMVYVGRVAISRYVGRVARELTVEPAAVPADIEVPAENDAEEVPVGRIPAPRYVGRVARSTIESEERAA